ncbi:hypothetical protein Q8A67_003726 [Cirrhinus molitorella]|uniref:Uncharacterized protein n=1 Tax=Cirrhinus molitorella TaxID=172907 RepID=A0AA88Q5Q5_9TELE|nr:hypothetical protein Q8A67_003726 [Cirrhinus molitorella]
MRATGGGPPCNPSSEIAEMVEGILGTANPSICGIADAPDPALLKLKELQSCKRHLDDAGAGPSSAVSSQDVSLCPEDEPSASQVFAQAVGPEDDIECLKKKKRKLQIKLLEIQIEYYKLKLEKIKKSQ